MLVLVVIGVDKRGAESCLGGLTIFAVFAVRAVLDKRGAESCLGDLTIFAVFAVRAVFAIFAVWAVP